VTLRPSGGFLQNGFKPRRSSPRAAADLAAVDLAGRFADVRALSERIAAPLSPEDQQVQSRDDVSPTKWHFAHVTWFFESKPPSNHLNLVNRLFFPRRMCIQFAWIALDRLLHRGRQAPAPPHRTTHPQRAWHSGSITHIRRRLHLEVRPNRA